LKEGELCVIAALWRDLRIAFEGRTYMMAADLSEQFLRRPYWARRIYQKFSSHCKRYVGVIQPVRRALPFQTTGFIFLKEHGRLDLSVESLLLKPKWKDLFADQDRADR
jgi:hypothetical protein